ncbi:hypothetical protein BH23PLA1_BH23PLA1_31320 [soil metagenome]
MKLRRSGPGRSIDWQVLHERLAHASEATQQAFRSSIERDQEIMDQRARDLARVPDRPLGAAEVLGVMTFTMAGEQYAIETHHVRGVVRLGTWTPIPGTPEELVGVINLRGEVLAVFDLSRLIPIPSEGPTESSQVIVLGAERDEFGILADRVHEIITLRNDRIFEPSGAVSGIGRRFLRGVAEDATLVLDGSILLQDERFVIEQAEELIEDSR